MFAQPGKTARLSDIAGMQDLSLAFSAMHRQMTNEITGKRPSFRRDALPDRTYLAIC